MPAVKVKENEPFDVALRRFKRSCEKAGLLAEVRKREHYEKPTTVRKRAAAAAVKRHLKKMSRENRKRQRLYQFPRGRNMSETENLVATIQTAMKAAMKAREKARLSTIRLIQAEFKRVEVDERIEIDDLRALAIMDKMVKQRRDSVTQFQNAGRDELAAIELAEIAVIQEFLPQQLSEAEIIVIIDEALAGIDATGMAAMGPLMGVIKPKLQGRADMGAVSKIVKAKLTA